MKQIKEGSKWWVGKHVTCKQCRAEWELELRDSPRRGEEAPLYNARYVICAHCGYPIVLFDENDITSY